MARTLARPRKTSSRVARPFVSRCAALLALVCAVAAAAPVTASLVKALSLAELTQRADLIVIGVPTEHASRRAGKLIVTDVSVRVDDVLKGRAERRQSVVATVLGGAIGDLGLQVPGEARLPIGQRMLAFLHRAREGSELRVVGMAQGVLPLHQRGEATLVLPGGAGAALVDPGSDGALRHAPAALTQPRPLGDMIAEIRRLVASQK